MHESLITLPSELIITFLTAMMPIGELRASVPLGILTFDLDWPSVLAVSIAGNLVPVPFLLGGLRLLGDWVEGLDNLLGTFLRWRTNRIKRRYKRHLDRYGLLAIVLLVAIPLPFTGAWTGALAVWTLQIPLRQAFPAIGVGVVIAGSIVTALTLGSVELFRRVG